MKPGWIVVLNGAPRSGKSSIAAAIQDGFDGPWMNFGVDAHVRHITPPRYRPGIGLRPGGERPDLEPWVPVFYAALYESVAAHARLGLNVVVDVGHHEGHFGPHEGHAVPRDTLRDCARRLAGLPALLVGVRCPVEEIMRRRRAEQPGREGEYATAAAGEPVPAPVLLWQREVHRPGIYDLELDASQLSPETCAAAIRRRLDDPEPPSAFRRLAGG